ncbi:MAG: hypothetical protein J6B04_04325 [Clostridia bacterium]|nr:hypothetical protein [Clostridia bacterium]
MKRFEKFFDILGEILAIVMVVVYVLWILDLNFGFLPETVKLVLEIARTYGSLLLVAVVGMEAISKRNLIIRLVFYAAVALVVVFLFFPETYAQLMAMVANL